MKTAVIHEWLVNYAGSERVLEQILHTFPEADIFCQVDFLQESERGFILNKKAKTSFIQNLPFTKTKYRSYLPLMPFAAGRLNVSDYDIIISNSHSVAKGVKKRPGQLHICYCHTPMRYAWDLRDQYLKESGLDSGIKGVLARYILGRIKKWDFTAAQSVDHFIANSGYIRDRIKRAYGKDSVVIYPPVDTDKFMPGGEKENYFLAASRMVPYKKMDLIVEAFSNLGLPLVVIGDGPDFKKVSSRAKRNIEFLGHQKDSTLIKYMQQARAFIFTAEEDFGIMPVEAQACGTPVIAFGKGGVTETVIPLKQSAVRRGESVTRPNTGTETIPTGIFFFEQTSSSLINAVSEFITIESQFDPQAIRKNSERFSIVKFRQEFKKLTDKLISDFFS